MGGDFYAIELQCDLDAFKRHFISVWIPCDGDRVFAIIKTHSDADVDSERCVVVVEHVCIKTCNRFACVRIHIELSNLSPHFCLFESKGAEIGDS